jgi:glycyl-tRNA synthetase beta chain
MHRSLLVELFVEELPPKALRKLGEAFAGLVSAALKSHGLADPSAVVTGFASPRRLAVHITAVAATAPDQVQSHKLMPASVGLDQHGQPSAALLKKLAALGADASATAALQRKTDGATENLYLTTQVKGLTLAAGLQKALDELLVKLPIPKLMTYQLDAGCELPGWTTVSFVRPVHGLVAMHGDSVVPVSLLGLQAGNTTHGHRFEASVSPLQLPDADSYEALLERDGAVIPGFEKRRAEIVRQLAQAASAVGDGAHTIDDELLLDEVTALVERPTVMTCTFDVQFLEVPQECLILTMKANQKYFPLLDRSGRLTNRFLVVSNIRPQDSSAVVGGNERVVRPRLADARFFFDQDRRRTLLSRLAELTRVVYHNKLGSLAERVERVCTIAQAIGRTLGGEELAAKAGTAAQLAKIDLLTDMVGEFPELQGIMGGYYARHDGLGDEIAIAIEDHYRPRFAGDALPRNRVALVVALADKLETLVGMFGTGNLPTGDRDPFALRRHALGVLRMLIDEDLPLDLDFLVDLAVPVFGDRIGDPRSALSGFVYERLAGALREQGYSAQEVDAVLALQPQRLGDVPKRLQAVRAFAALPQSAALAAANKRIGNILKKSAAVDAHVSAVLLQEAAEIALHSAMQEVLPKAQQQLLGGQYAQSLATLAALGEPVDAFFEQVMVNADAMDVRLNRLGLLATLHHAMNRVADLSRLAS